jgi:hypothetical protein
MRRRAGRQVTSGSKVMARRRRVKSARCEV